MYGGDTYGGGDMYGGDMNAVICTADMYGVICTAVAICTAAICTR